MKKGLKKQANNENNKNQFNPEKKNIHLNNKNEKKIIVRIFINKL
jgi:hypothetical protein